MNNLEQVMNQVPELTSKGIEDLNSKTYNENREELLKYPDEFNACCE
jgi:hypothetical protein